jgi:small subunit ribosomal protein S16
MTVKVRLSRGGTTNAPFYSIVAADSRAPRDGKFIEKLGYYNPKVSKEKETELNKRVSFNEERVKYWVSVGAEISETVAKLLVKEGFSDASKFIKPFVKGEFFGIKRKEKKKILSDRADVIKKAAAEKKKAAEAAKKAAAAAAASA